VWKVITPRKNANGFSLFLIVIVGESPPRGNEMEAGSIPGGETGLLY
jgi:hypothetical protein